VSLILIITLKERRPHGLIGESIKKKKKKKTLFLEMERKK
jgi:hypothetical protein